MGERCGYCLKGVVRIFAHILLFPALRRKKRPRRRLRNPQRKRRRRPQRRTTQGEKIPLRVIRSLSPSPRGGSYPKRKRNMKCSMLH